MFKKRICNTFPDTRKRTIVYDTAKMEDLDRSIYGAFRKCIMAFIDQGMFMCMYSQFGAPNSAVDILIGVMILAAIIGVSEDRILEDLPFSLNYQYALCLDLATDKIPCKRTLIRFRLRCMLYTLRTGIDVYHQQCVLISQRMAAELNLKPNYFRMDSVMLNTFAQKINRSQLLYQAIQSVVFRLAGLSRSKVYRDERENHFTMDEVLHRADLKELHEVDHCLADQAAQQVGLPRALWHYLYLDDYNARFYAHRNPVERTGEILSDAVLLWNRYYKELKDWEEFKLFVRVVNEQCEWVLEFQSARQDNCDYTGKKVLRFKLSREEREKAAKKQGVVSKLRNAADEQYQKWQRAKNGYEKAARKAETAINKATSAKDSSKYDSLLKKAIKLQQVAESKMKDSQKKRSLFESTIDELTSASSLVSEKEAYVVVDDSLRKGMQEMNSGILQTLHDSTATFCEKAGAFYRGYKLCAIEMSDGKGHSMPVEWDTQPNNVSDVIMGAVLIGRLKVYSFVKKYIVADGAFSGKEIDDRLQEVNGEIINTEMTGQKVKDCYADIAFNEDGSEMLRCPAGHEVRTIRCNKDGSVVASLDAAFCKTCPYFKDCAPSLSNSKATIKASTKQKVRAIFQRRKGEVAHSVFGRFRNGVEALMNKIKKKSPVTRQPIYGLQRVAFFNDTFMVACSFEKYLAQTGFSESVPTVSLEYSDLFPEEEDYLEEAKEDVDRELKSILNEGGPHENRGHSSCRAEARDAVTSLSGETNGSPNTPSPKTVEYELIVFQPLEWIGRKTEETVTDDHDSQKADHKGKEEKYIFLVDPEGICTPTLLEEAAILTEESTSLPIQAEESVEQEESLANKTAERQMDSLPVHEADHCNGIDRSLERTAGTKRKHRRLARIVTHKKIRVNNGEETAFN